MYFVRQSPRKYLNCLGKHTSFRAYISKHAVKAFLQGSLSKIFHLQMFCTIMIFAFHLLGCNGSWHTPTQKSVKENSSDIVFPNVDLQYKKVDNGVKVTVIAQTNRHGEQILRQGMFDFELLAGRHSLKLWSQQHNITLTDMPTQLFSCIASQQAITDAQGKLTVVIRVASGPMKGSSQTNEFVVGSEKGSEK